MVFPDLNPEHSYRKSESSWTGDYNTGTSATTLKDLKVVVRNQTCQQNRLKKQYNNYILYKILMPFYQTLFTKPGIFARALRIGGIKGRLRLVEMIIVISLDAVATVDVAGTEHMITGHRTKGVVQELLGRSLLIGRRKQ